MCCIVYVIDPVVVAFVFLGLVCLGIFVIYGFELDFTIALIHLNQLYTHEEPRKVQL